MQTNDLDFHLPEDLIAQTPAERREQSRLLHYRRTDRSIAHRHFKDLPSLLKKGDLLVFNDARVMPARFTLTKPTGGRVEALFLDSPSPRRWRVMLKNLGPVRGDQRLVFAEDNSITATVLAKHEDEYEIELNTDEPAPAVLSRFGRMPLPPYIKRAKDHDDRDDFDRARYQTVYAKEEGSVAAPTAGLHFTPELIDQLSSIGVERAFVTLHVGMGTFKPISTDALSEHRMHTERYTISPAAADAINAAKREGRRVIAVGTTAARVLESQRAGAPIAPKTGETAIFIYPPYDWRFVDAMITNFHLPRSTLIALVAAMVGLDEQRRIYATAIEQRYRFFSYGDASLIE